MRASKPWPFLIFGILFSVLVALPAQADDLTVYVHYTFADRDTATRAFYYGKDRIRGTMSDGTEAIYDHKAKELIFLNHKTKRFWQGPIDRANTIIDSLTLERDKPFWEATQEKQKEWFAFTEKFNESIESTQIGGKKILSKICTGWLLTAGENAQHERWVATDLEVPDFIDEFGKIALLPALDPVGRAMGRLILQARAREKGTPLAARTRIKTPLQEVEFSWEAFKLDLAPIPDSVWEVPEGYEEIKF